MKDLVDKLIKEEEIKRDNMSLRIFGKHEVELSLPERDELDDWMNPQWRLIDSKYGYRVEVSNTGSVRDPDTKELYTVYEPKEYHTWYPYVYINGIPKTVHVLVAQAFVPNPENKPEVNHIDGHKTHNWYRNLEWVTHEENIQHAIKTGLFKPLKGESSPLTKYTNVQIKRVCELLVAHPDWTFDKISEETGVAWHTISDVYYKHKWKEISKDYDFPKRNTHAKGENAGSSRYTEDQIEQVCTLLDKVYSKAVKMTRKGISEITGVNPRTIRHIWIGEAWVHVAKNHEFYKSKFNKGD